MKSKDLFYCDSAINELPLYFRYWMSKHLKNIPIKVPIRRNCLTGSGVINKCHWNCHALKKVFGGNVLEGYLITNNEKYVKLSSHSIWITPEGKAVDVTANNYTSTDKFIYFVKLFERNKSHQNSTIIILKNYKKNGVLVDFCNENINLKVAENLNYKLINNRFVNYPSSQFNSKLFNSYSCNENFTNEELRIADFKLPSTASNKTWNQIFNERISNN